MPIPYRTIPASFLTSALLLAFALPASAQLVDISACRAIEDRLERFICYENLEPGDSGSARAGNPPPPPATGRPSPAQPELGNAAPAPAPSRSEAAPAAGVEDFGRSDNENARIVQDDDGEQELHDTIAGLQELAPNTWLITLSSGQQWRQMSGKRYMMREGDEVRIYPSIWGRAYRLTATRLSGYIQVERIR